MFTVLLLALTINIDSDNGAERAAEIESMINTVVAESDCIEGEGLMICKDGDTDAIIERTTIDGKDQYTLVELAEGGEIFWVK